ncbi:DUF2971 domain-containing protein [Chromobacterium haemolyticum]|uniref:DUF2971 domain-containing protein n=1 Tax=Chromobacterium fluminis TaxID=3044269 RepID=A0ABX0LFJ1_9NEIS|nr:DUF2971 domain-containing protein [Chromobacterium haemolyticum]NHR07993.1 DUF2971 domain-containing protein [Chromobacterium haemolyticum]
MRPLIKPSTQSLIKMQQSLLADLSDPLTPTPKDQRAIDQFNTLPREQKIQIYLELTPPKPINLYKYFTSPLCFEDNNEISKRKKWLESILLNHELYLSSHTQFNDPFDVYPSYKTDASANEIKSALRRAYKNLHQLSGRELKEATATRLIWALKNKETFIENNIKSIREIMKDVGIFCFTTDATNILMWSHYAFNHQGICLEFDLTEELHLSNLIFDAIYSDTRPKIDPIAEAKPEIFNLTLLRKAKSWEYEKELRLVVGKLSGSFVKFGENFLKSVIIGAKASESTISYINEINMKRVQKQLPQLQIKNAKLCKTEYKIII